MSDLLGAGGRREAREDALAVLYEAELTSDSPVDALARREVSLEGYAIDVIHGVSDNRARLDELIAAHLEGWRLERLAIVDATIARMAAWELCHRDDVPTGVVLSEAVALATQYASGESPRFLNGVLSAIAASARG